MFLSFSPPWSRGFARRHTPRHQRGGRGARAGRHPDTPAP
jgi:hypothetical protein